MPEPVIITEYDPEWSLLFDQIARPIEHALGDTVVAVDHVGSTSVPGLAAKPIIDIDVVVCSETDVPTAIRQLKRLGYTHQGDLGVPGREAFTAPPGSPRQHLYLVVEKNQAHLNHIRWRDLLRSNPQVAREYAELKMALAEQYGTDRDGYQEAKTDFITGSMTRAGLAFHHPGSPENRPSDHSPAAARSDQFDIRAAHAADAEAIAWINVSTFRQAFTALFPPDALATLDIRERTERQRQRLKPNSGIHVFVASDREKLIGYVALGPTRDGDGSATPGAPTGEVYAIYVLPDMWSRRVGQSLMSHALETARTVGYQQATLWVFEDNNRARKFYEQGGWRQEQRRIGTHFGIEIPKIRYRIDLGRPARVNRCVDS